MLNYHIYKIWALWKTEILDFWCFIISLFMTLKLPACCACVTKYSFPSSTTCMRLFPFFSVVLNLIIKPAYSGMHSKCLIMYNQGMKVLLNFPLNEKKIPSSFKLVIWKESFHLLTWNLFSLLHKVPSVFHLTQDLFFLIKKKKKRIFIFCLKYVEKSNKVHVLLTHLNIIKVLKVLSLVFLFSIHSSFLLTDIFIEANQK